MTIVSSSRDYEYYIDSNRINIHNINNNHSNDNINNNINNNYNNNQDNKY